MTTKFILHCKNDHYFMQGSICPYCGEHYQDTVEYREGDCISCGQLCPGYAYGCTSPAPINSQDKNSPKIREN